MAKPETLLDAIFSGDLDNPETSPPSKQALESLNELEAHLLDQTEIEIKVTACTVQVKQASAAESGATK